MRHFYFCHFPQCFFYPAEFRRCLLKAPIKLQARNHVPEMPRPLRNPGTSIPTPDALALARALPLRRASSYKTHTCSSSFLTRYSNGCTRRSLLLRAEWALVDEILTSENRNPLRDLQRGSPPPLLVLFSLFLLPSNDGGRW